MSTLTHKLSQIVLAAVMGAIVSNAIPQLSVAQNVEQDEVTRVKLDLDGLDREWIRIERTGNVVRFIHTIRSAQRDGIGGVANFLIDTLGPSNLSFSDWGDHQTTRVLFEPDYCSTNSTSQDVPTTPSQTGTSNSQLRLPLDSSNCAVVGTDTLILPEGISIHQGQFTIEYIERELLRAITFRVPEDK